MFTILNINDPNADLSETGETAEGCCAGSSTRPLARSEIGRHKTPDAYDCLVRVAPPSARRVAADIAEALATHNEADAVRLAFQFVERYDRAAASDRPGMVVDEPAAVGDPRFDALLAAVVEFCCARHHNLAPSWVGDPNRFLQRWWFVSGLRSLHADAIAHSPISFARRGVFITENALTYA